MSTVRYTSINGEVIAEKRNGVRKHYVPDPLGSTAALIDNTQTQTDTFSYWPYGEERVVIGTTPTPFRFVGTQGYYKDGSSRTYVRTRHLRTDHGHWLTNDRIGFAGRDFNLYRYVHNNPVSYIDPSGEQEPIITPVLPSPIVIVTIIVVCGVIIIVRHVMRRRRQRIPRKKTGWYPCNTEAQIQECEFTCYEIGESLISGGCFVFYVDDVPTSMLCRCSGGKDINPPGNEVPIN